MEKKKKKLLDADTWKRDAHLVETTLTLRKELGGDLFEDYNLFRDRVDDAIKQLDLKFTAADLKTVLRAVSWRVETAPPVIDKLLKEESDALHGRYPLSILGQSEISNRKSKIRSVSFEPDPNPRDTEQNSFLEAPSSGLPGDLPSEATAKVGIEAFIRREILPYTPDAWIKADATKIGYEISFTRHFYQPQPLRTLEQIRADILAVEKEAEGLLDELLKGGA
ncbi:MAG TPA: hypothetical protein PLX89_12810 [Verrucomicrobiota bacterium]|nr:hypothetical protein [Verrucomicrobiales bacterium]HRI13873.1 hypothetical protein [Verrucomicrobiota bacterium]